MGGAANAAVVAVGRTFFRITLLGYTLSGLAMFPAVILGLRSGYFEWEMDRCNCATGETAVVSTTSAGSTSAGAPTNCVMGKDFAKVSIGWQKFTYDDIVHTNGCPAAYARFNAEPEVLKDSLDDPQTFEVFGKVYRIDDGFQKTDSPTQADESNGGAEAGGGVVAMQVVLTFFSIFTYKMLKASYISNGSHCSVGLGLMTRLNLLMGLGTAAAIVSFWWLIEGRFGDEDKALTMALENVSLFVPRPTTPFCFSYCRAQATSLFSGLFFLSIFFLWNRVMWPPPKLPVDATGKKSQPLWVWWFRSMLCMQPLLSLVCLCIFLFAPERTAFKRRCLLPARYKIIRSAQGILLVLYMQILVFERSSFRLLLLYLWCFSRLPTLLAPTRARASQLDCRRTEYAILDDKER